MRKRLRSDHDAANNSRDKQERRREQHDVNGRLNLLPRLRSPLGTIELIHMRIRNAQIRHVLPPFVFLYAPRVELETDIHTFPIN